MQASQFVTVQVLKPVLVIVEELLGTNYVPPRLSVDIVLLVHSTAAFIPSGVSKSISSP